MATWIEEVEKILNQLGGKSDISTIVDRIKGKKDLSKNEHLRETVRGTLNRNTKKFKSYGGGVWGVITHDTEKDKKKL